MTNHQLASVVFPIGPGVPNAALALGDLLAQSYPELEIIAVLNGCSSEVREVFELEQDPRLKVIDLGEEPQLLNALNSAIDHARGHWLARMDADDRSSPDRLERTIALLESGDCEVASCGIELVRSLGDGMLRYVDWVNELVQPEDVSIERFVESPVVQPTVVMSKSIFEESGGYLNDGFAEDYSLWLRLLAQGRRFGKVKEKLYYWHDRPDRLTRSDPRFGHKKMLALKAGFLAKLQRVIRDGVVICGAGPNGRVLARELLARKIKVHGFFEVDPRRVGSTCQGAPIRGQEDFGVRWRDAVLLSAVGGKRDAIRQIAKHQGYREGENFWCCC